MPLEQFGFEYITKGVTQGLANIGKLVLAQNQLTRSTQQLRAPAGGFMGVQGGRFLTLAQSQILRQTQATQALQVASANLGSSFKALGVASLATFAPVTKLKESFSSLGKVVATLSKDLGTAAYFLGRMQFVLISAVAALAGLGAPVIFAAQFEAQMAKIAGLTNVPREAIAGLRDNIISLSKEIAKSPQELGVAAYFILSSGIQDAASATKLLELSAKASTAGLGETQDVARVLVAVMNAYGLNANEAAGITNELVAAVREGSAEASDLVGSIGRVIPVAAQMGVEFAQVVSVLASMTNIGLSTERSTTGLIGIMSQLLKPTDASRRLFKSLNIEIEDFRKEIDENFIGAMDRLFAAFAGKETIVAELFPDLRGFIGSLAAFGRERQGETAAIFGRIANNVTALGLALEEAQNTLSFKFKKALNDVRVSLLQVGQTLLPTMKRAFDGISHFVERATEGARNFRREWGPTIRNFAEGLKESLEVIKAFGRTLFSVTRAPGVSLSLKVLAESVKLLAKNFDLLVPAITAFAIVFIAGKLTPAIIAAAKASFFFVQALRLWITTGLATAAVNQAIGVSLGALTTGIGGPVLAIALLAGGLVFGKRLLDRFSEGAKKAEGSIVDLGKLATRLRAPFLKLGLTEQAADFALIAERYAATMESLNMATKDQEELAARLESVFAAQQIPELRLPTFETKGIEDSIRASQEVAQNYLDNLEEIKEKFDEIDSTVDRIALAEALEKAKVPAEVIADLLPDIAIAAAEAGYKGSQAIKDYGDSLQDSSERTAEFADIIDSLTNAFSGLRSQLRAIAGVRTAEEAQLEFEISQRELAINQIKSEAFAYGDLSDAQKNTIGVLEDDIELRQTQIDVFRGQREVQAGLIETTLGLLPANRDLIDLMAAVAIQSREGERTLDALRAVEEDFRRESNTLAADLVKGLIASLTQINDTHTLIRVDALQVDKAIKTVDELLRSWNALGDASAMPITLTIGIESFLAPARDIASSFLDSAANFVRRAVEITRGRIPRGAGAAKEINPFEEFVREEQVREIFQRVAETGKASWSDVARLWELGAKDAAEDFARFMRGEMSKIGVDIANSFRAMALKWMGAVEEGILDGTVDVLDALNFLEKGMIDAARSITEGLAKQADSIAEQWQILIEVLTTGMATIQQVNRLLQLGAIGPAAEFMKFMLGRPSTLTGAVAAFQRSTSPFRGLQHGGFIPPGPPVPAILHGPEVVVPLGNLNVLSALQRALSGFGGGGGEGFRNYGSVHVHASDRDSMILRSMTRALGVA